MLKKLIHLNSLRRYHKYHKIAATRVLRRIESSKGKINSSLVKQSNDYAQEILGWKGYAPWLYVYCAIAGKFREGWIPDNYYGKWVVPYIKGKYGEISNLRGLNSFFISTQFSPDKLYYINDCWYDSKYNPVSSSEITNFLREDNKYIFKQDNSQQGGGITIFSTNKATNFSIEKLKHLGNGVVQTYIRQHPFFENFSTNSTATIRLTTSSLNREIKTIASYLRVGRTEDRYIKSASHIRIPVDLQNGILYEKGYTTEWSEIYAHPDTQVAFANKKIPNYYDCIQSVQRLHAIVPFVGIIGWDLTIDEEGNVKVMEWNGAHNDIKFSEATQGPIFKNMGLQNLWKMR